MNEWFDEWFDADYLKVYPHRDLAEARLAIEHIVLPYHQPSSTDPWLDVACGGGRHLQVMLEHGINAFGTDRSMNLLKSNPPQQRSSIFRADMRQLPCRSQSFHGISLWFSSFGYFDDTSNEAMLRHFQNILMTSGILIIDFMNAHEVIKTLVPEDQVIQGDLEIKNKRYFDGPRLMKEIEILNKSTGERRHVQEAIWFYTPEAIAALALKAGFALKSEYGDYQGHPFQSNSPRWIGIFHPLSSN